MIKIHKSFPTAFYSQPHPLYLTRDQLQLQIICTKLHELQLMAHTWTSNVKYFFKFLMIITKNGSLIPRVFFASAGQVMYVVLTLVPTISRTNDWISLSVILFICPFLTFLSHICKGLLPMLYKIDKNPLWNVFLNMTPLWSLQTAHDTIRRTVCFQLWSKSGSVQNLPR